MTHHTHHQPVPDTDASLRSLLRQTAATPTGPDLSAWHTHRAQHSLQHTGPAATLGRAQALWPRHAALGWLVLAMALCMAVGLRPTHDAALAELQQPDVLSQILLDDL
jgi:hypothetical protein